jgi:hypothetical protein
MSLNKEFKVCLDQKNLDPNNFCSSGLRIHEVAAMFPLLPAVISAEMKLKDAEKAKTRKSYRTRVGAGAREPQQPAVDNFISLKIKTRAA